MTILISFLACCASKASAHFVSGYVDVIRGFKSTFFRLRRSIASAKQPGVNRTVPVASQPLNFRRFGRVARWLVPLILSSLAVSRNSGTDVNGLPSPAWMPAKFYHN